MRMGGSGVVNLSNLFGYVRRPKLIRFGTFQCPACRDETNYRAEKNVLYFMFCLMPVIPLRDLDTYIQCNECKKQFDSQVLTFKEREDPLGDFQETAIKLLIFYMLAFEKTDPQHIEACRFELCEMTGDDVPLEAIRMELVKKSEIPEPLNRLSRESDRLNVEEKFRVLRRIRNIALVDKTNLLDHEQEFRRLAAALGFGADKFEFVVGTLLQDF